MGRPPEMRTWVPWSELAQKPRGTLDEFHAQLRKYPRSSLLRIAATHMSWAHVHAGSTPATRTIFLVLHYAICGAVVA